jgi:hypothetical protein
MVEQKYFLLKEQLQIYERILVQTMGRQAAGLKPGPGLARPGHFAGLNRTRRL